MKPDLIECWPRHEDYPLHRQFIHYNRDRFSKVIIVFTNMNVPNLDYREDIKEFMKLDDISFMDNDNVAADKDWRNIAVNKALTISTAQWVWFTEQDFMIYRPDKFWTGIVDLVDSGADAIAYWQGNQRLHPCCFFIKRFLMDNFTSKDFGVVKDELDHFEKFAQEVNDEEQISLYKLKEESKLDWFEHMNGLSQNMWMLQQGIEPNYRPEDFKEYCRKCLEVKPIHPDFERIFREYISR